MFRIQHYTLCLALIAGLGVASNAWAIPSVTIDLQNVDDGLDDQIDFDLFITVAGSPGDFLQSIQVNLADSSPAITDATFSLFTFTPTVPVIEQQLPGVGYAWFFPAPFLATGVPTQLADLQIDASGLTDGQTYTVDLTGGSSQALTNTQATGFSGQAPVFLDVAFANQTGQTDFTVPEDDQPDPEVIPEPITGTLGLIALSAVGLAATRRRR